MMKTIDNITVHDREYLHRMGKIFKEKCKDVLPLKSNCVTVNIVECSKTTIKLSFPIKFFNVNEDFMDVSYINDKCNMIYCSAVFDKTMSDRVVHLTSLNYNRLLFDKIDFNIFYNILSKEVYWDKFTAKYFNMTNVPIDFEVTNIDSLVKAIKTAFDASKDNIEQFNKLIHNKGIIEYCDIIKNKEQEISMLKEQIKQLNNEKHLRVEKLKVIFQKNIDILKDLC